MLSSYNRLTGLAKSDLTNVHVSFCFLLLVVVFALLLFILVLLGGACVCVCVRACVRACAHVCVRSHTHRHRQTQTDTDRHAQTHTNTQTIENQTGREPSASFGIEGGLAHLNQEIDVYRRCLIDVTHAIPPEEDIGQRHDDAVITANLLCSRVKFEPRGDGCRHACHYRHLPRERVSERVRESERE
jgi:hypothetical protein